MPIDKNTTKYEEKNGRVTGVKLEIITPPGYQYVVDTLVLIDENTAMGKTVATCYVEGSEKCYLGYPLSNDGNFQNVLNPNHKNEHIISNGYNPQYGLGPLSIFVGDGDRKCISQIVNGFGLPNKHHVSFVVGFKKAGVIQPPNENEEIIILKNRVKFLEGKIEMIIS